jgi:sRNA-binding regulator protein Hfq
MRNTILVIAFLFSAILTGNSQETKSAAIHNADTAWQKLNNVKAQQRVKVYLKNGTEVKGSFVRVEENGILLRIKHDESVLISREEIFRITGHYWKRASMIGLAIGAGGGGLLWAMPILPFFWGRTTVNN